MDWATIGATDGNSGVLRFEYATDQTLKERATLQLFVSAPRVRELAEGLTRLAEYLERAAAGMGRRAARWLDADESPEGEAVHRI